MQQRRPPRTDPRELGDPLKPGFRIDDSPFYLMARAYGRYTHAMEDSLRAIGMDLPRWRVLMLVHEKSPSSISEIADRAVVRLSTMTRVAQRMAADGLVRLATHKGDARVTEVFITARGRAAVKQVRTVASGVYRGAIEGFSATDIAALTKTLARLFTNLEKGDRAS